MCFDIHDNITYELWSLSCLKAKLINNINKTSLHHVQFPSGHAQIINGSYFEKKVLHGKMG
jgi:hypothetical protein